MDQFHELVASAAIAGVVGARNGLDVGKVIDLGCGNGQLLELILERAPWLIPCGVEEDSGRHQRAARRLLPYDPELYLGSISSEDYWQPPYSIACVNLRELEALGTDVSDLLQKLQQDCHRVVVYSFERKDYPSTLNGYFKLNTSFTNGVAVAYLLEPLKHDRR